MVLRVLNWSSLSVEERRQALRRPLQQDVAAVHEQVREIIGEVRARGDSALLEFTRRFDGVALAAIEVSTAEFAAAETALSTEQRQAIDRAIANVRKFHEAQLGTPLRVETAPGVVCERPFRPIDAVRLYLPAGVAPLPSAAIMVAVPARIAGCPTRIMCTPPRRDGTADPAVLTIANLCGIRRVFKLGGAQAIAAMAYGTQTVPNVDKVLGPGNSWVTAAKLQVANDPEGAALDLPAGPSEVLVIADATARSEFVAADLLAQAEHSDDAQVIFVTTSSTLAEATAMQIESQTKGLGRADTVRK